MRAKQKSENRSRRTDPEKNRHAFDFIASANTPDEWFHLGLEVTVIRLHKPCTNNTQDENDRHLNVDRAGGRKIIRASTYAKSNSDPNNNVDFHQYVKRTPKHDKDHV
jgi:hypothetical protein